MLPDEITQPSGRRVLVVGAGPAGLVAAITLARMGVPCLLVDRRREPSNLPRATVLSLRTMELLRGWGLHDAVVSGGHDVEWLMSVSPTLREASTGQLIEVGYPTTGQSALISPTRPANVPQDHLETVLMAHLRGLPLAEVRLGVELADLVPGPSGCRVLLRDLMSGGIRTECADYVLAADGAHSPIRNLLDIAMPDSGSQYEALSMVVRAPLWDLVADHRCGIYSVQDRTGFASFLPAGHPDRWVFSIGWDPATERLSDYSTGRLTTLIRESAGDPLLDVQIDRVGSFSFVGGIAERFRKGRVFLLGDAAHRVTPRGGTGLNTAVADGFDIGWKLSWVVRGWAATSLLDTYEVERRPVAEHNLRRSLDPAGSRRPAINEVLVDLGPRIPHLWLPDADRAGAEPAARCSTLDLVSSGISVITANRDPIPDGMTAALGLTAPITVHRVDAMTARALGAGTTGSVRLRPDGAVLGRG